MPSGDKNPSRARGKQVWFTPCHLYRRLFIQAWCIIASCSPEGVTFAALHVCKGTRCVRGGTWRPMNLARSPIGVQFEIFLQDGSLTCVSEWPNWDLVGFELHGRQAQRKKMIDVRLCTRVERTEEWSPHPKPHPLSELTFRWGTEIPLWEPVAAGRRSLWGWESLWVPNKPVGTHAMLQNHYFFGFFFFSLKCDNESKPFDVTVGFLQPTQIHPVCVSLEGTFWVV